MYVKLGKYTNWIGPYQLADLLQYVGVSEDRCYALGERLADIKWLCKACEFIYSFRERKEIVRIDDYDVWSADYNISFIVLPLLKRLKELKHGAPFVAMEDVPETLRSDNPLPTTTEGWEGTDEKWQARWDYVLDEMIFAHENIVDESWETKFFSGEPNLDNIKFTEGEAEAVSLRAITGTRYFDVDGYKAHTERIENGLRLFGKYYRGLWD
jgi:hypothetical protein